MISRASVGRNVQATVCRQCHAKPNNRRGLAAAASGSFSYETGETSGVRFASRDLPGPTTHLAIVANAGTRYQPLPGFSEALEKFAFKVGPAFISDQLIPCNSIVYLSVGCLYRHLIEYFQTLCPENNQGGRVAGRRTVGLSFKGKSCDSCKIPKGRPALLYRATRRGYLKNQIHPYVLSRFRTTLWLMNCRP